MPPLIAPIAGLLGGGFLAELLVGTALYIGGTLLSQALAPKPAAQKDPGVELSIRLGGDSPLSFMVGLGATAGHRTYAGTWGQDGETPNAFFVDVLEIANAPVDGYEGVRVDGEPGTILWDEAHPDYGYPIAQGRKDGKDHLWVKFHDGRQTVADPYLRAKFGDHPDRPYDADMVGQGTAYAIVTTRYNRELWQGATPGVLFEVRGLRCYDLRKDSTAGGSGAHRRNDQTTWEWTENPYVIAYNVAFMGVYVVDEWLWGLQNLPALRLPTSAWIAAMNEADRTLPAWNDQRQFVIGGEVTVDMEPAVFLEEVAKSSAGRWIESAGSYKPRCGAPGASIFAFTADDLLLTEPRTITPFPGLEQTHNTVEVSYTEPSEAWRPNAAPVQSKVEYVAADGNRKLVASLSLPFVRFNEQAQRLGFTYLEDGRRFRQLQASFHPISWLFEPGDVIDGTILSEGYNGKAFEILEMSGRRTFVQTITLREIDPGDFDPPSSARQPWSVGSIKVEFPPVQAPTDITFEPYIFEDAEDRSRRPGILGHYRGAMDDVESVMVEIRQEGVTEPFFREPFSYAADRVGVVNLPIASPVFFPNLHVEVRGRYLPFSARETGWTDWVKITIPDVPIDAELDILDDSIISAKIRDAAITSSKIMDEAVTELKLADEAVSAAKIAAGAVLNDKLADLSVSLSKIQNGAVNGDKLADAAVTASKIANETITATKFASGIRPVEILSALPTTGNFAGRMVYLTTDGKLYRHTGSPAGAAGFTAAVDGSDITGEIVATDIADDSITTPKLRANAVTTAKLDALAVTADKIAANAITTGKIQAGAVSADQIATNAITASKIAADTITGDKIVAGTITAREMVLTDTQNLVQNSNFEAGLDPWVISTSAGASAPGPGEIIDTITGSAVPDLENSSALRIVNNTNVNIGVAYKRDRSTNVNLRSDFIQIAAGETIYAEAMVYSSVAIPAGTPIMQLSLARASDGSTTSSTIAVSDAIIPANTWTKVTGTRPASTEVYGTVRILSNIASTRLIRGVVVLRRNAANLIVDGAITANHLAADSVTTNALAAGSVTANAIATNAVTADKVQANAITGVKIQGGTITGDKIAGNTITGDKFVANTITARELILTDFENLILNGTFAQGLAGWNMGVGTTVLYNRGQGGGSGESSPTPVYAGMDSVSTRLDWGIIPVKAGEEFLFAMQGARSSSGTVSAGIRARWYDADMVQIGGSITYENFTNVVWRQYSYAWTAPAGAAFLRAEVVRTTDDSPGRFAFTNVQVFRRKNADLIVDGAITADKLLANSVTSNALAAGSVTANAISAGAITAGKISAGAINASNLFVNGVVITDVIAANAATQASSTYVGGAVGFTGSGGGWTTVNSLTVTSSSGWVVSFTWSGRFNGVVNVARDIQVGFYRGETQLAVRTYTIWGDATYPYITVPWQDTPGSGTFTYSVRIQSSNAASGTVGDVGQRYLNALQFKR